MQTFMPWDTYQDSVRALDDSRLGKQRVEAMQILNAILDPGYGWQSHPAVNMWRGHGFALAIYGMHACIEWARRGHQDSLMPQFVAMQYLAVNSGERATAPEWVSSQQHNLSHQSNLIRKDPDFYSSVFPGVSDDIEYVWTLTEHEPQTHEWPSVKVKEGQVCCECPRGKTSFAATRTRKGTEWAQGPGTWWSCVRCGLPQEDWLRAARLYLCDSIMEGGPQDDTIYTAHEMFKHVPWRDGYVLQPDGRETMVGDDMMMRWEFVL